MIHGGAAYCQQIGDDHHRQTGSEEKLKGAAVDHIIDQQVWYVPSQTGS